MGRWQLGNPSLVVNLPADPRAGGVAWHENDAYGIITTSWSAESDAARMEISSVYTSTPAPTLANQLATKLGGQVSNGRASKVSGQDAYRFNLGNRSGLAISGSGKCWILLGTPKNGQGQSLVEASLTSALVERTGNPRWVRRSLGGTRMHAELPFDFAQDNSRPVPGNRRAYELLWNDMEITAFVQTANEGMKIDYEGSVRDYIDGESKMPGTENYKSKRERVRLDRITGDIVTLDFERNKKGYRVRSFFALDSNRMLRMSISTQPSRSDHEEAAERIVRTFKVSGVSFEGFEPRRVGNEPLYIDLPKEVEAKGNGLYSVFVGAFGTDIRVTPINPRNGHNEDQLASMLTAKYQGRADIKDFKADTTRRLVDGLEARVVRASYKSKAGMKTHEVALAIFAAEAIYTVETIVGENEIEYLDRILDSVRFETPPPDGWSRQVVGEAGFSLFWPKRPEAKTDPGDGVEVDKTMVFENIQDGIVNTVVELKLKQRAPEPGVVLPTFARSLAGGMGATHQILDQRPVSIGSAAGIHAKLSFTMNGKTLPGDMIVLRKGLYIWTLVVVHDPASGKSVHRQALVNSIR